ncbi:zinc finger FYVE domain-containing protein 21-like isoform X3 [Haemaphysalis longicornis]
MTAVHKKLVKSKSGLRIVAVGSDELSPFHLDEPPWTPDRETADCGRCRSKFDFITRRHHCRRCGRVYCSSCCSRRLPLQRMCFVDPVRICHDCSPVTLRENDFYDRHLRLLLAGAHFLVSALPDTAIVPHSCRLSADHRALEVENCQSGECTAIPLVSIASHRLLRPSSPSIGDSPEGDLDASAAEGDMGTCAAEGDMGTCAAEGDMGTCAAEGHMGTCAAEGAAEEVLVVNSGVGPSHVGGDPLSLAVLFLLHV